jgi:Wnt-binding factor required for Wnt secretion
MHFFQRKAGYYYSCSIVPLFELGSLHHDYYLLDIRLPVDDNNNMNNGLGQIVDIWLVVGSHGTIIYILN